MLPVALLRRLLAVPLLLRWLLPISTLLLLSVSTCNKQQATATHVEPVNIKKTTGQGGEPLNVQRAAQRGRAEPIRQPSSGFWAASGELGCERARSREQSVKSCGHLTVCMTIFSSQNFALHPRQLGQAEGGDLTAG
jgi:hypothetical protein